MDVNEFNAVSQSALTRIRQEEHNRVNAETDYVNRLAMQESTKRPHTFIPCNQRIGGNLVSQLLSEVCDRCGHVFMVHRIDGNCAACRMVVAAENLEYNQDA